METEIKHPDSRTESPPAPFRSKSSLRFLVQSLSGDIKTFFRQEIELAKTEASEKAAWLGRNAIGVAAGGLVAYAGLIVLLIGLGWLVAWALQHAGLSPVLAGFVGLAIIGFLVALVGGLFVLKSIKALSTGSLAPQRTIHTIQRLKGSEAPAAPTKENNEPSSRPSSDEMQTRVEQTENHMGETLDELGRRLSPKEINTRMKRRISQKPYRSGLLAMGVGVVSGLFLARESRR